MHSNGMLRTHHQIISDAGGYKSLADKLDQPVDRVRFWERRKAIPPEQWMAVAAAGVATLDELVTAAAKRTKPEASDKAA